MLEKSSESLGISIAMNRQLLVFVAAAAVALLAAYLAWSTLFEPADGPDQPKPSVESAIAVQNGADEPSSSTDIVSVEEGSPEPENGNEISVSSVATTGRFIKPVAPSLLASLPDDFKRHIEQIQAEPRYSRHVVVEIDDDALNTAVLESLESYESGQTHKAVVLRPFEDVSLSAWIKTAKTGTFGGTYASGAVSIDDPSAQADIEIDRNGFVTIRVRTVRTGYFVGSYGSPDYYIVTELLPPGPNDRFD